MPTPLLSDEDIHERLAVFRRRGSINAAAKELGVSRQALQHTLRVARRRGMDCTKEREFEIPDLPDEDPDGDALWKRREADYIRRANADDARKVIPIKIKTEGPIAILFFGDLHIDSPGCDIKLIREHTDLVLNTEGMFAISLGDLQDGWIGRLARLWAQQGISSKQSYILVKHWIEWIAEKLLAIIDGNHDAWTVGINDVGPVDWIAARTGVLNQRDGVRLRVELPAGKSITINARHDFRGRSQYNAAHGQTKAALFGWRDDIVVGGHTHQSGYNIVKDPMTGRVSHALRVASYKKIDQYAKTEGLPDENVSECVVAIIDPTCDDPRHVVSIEFNAKRAARTLAMLRKEWARRK